MDKLTDLTGLYPVSKTLRFELKPIGKTLENIERKGIIAQDEQRAEDYEVVKGLIDKYHKAFIKECLWNCKLKLNSTEEYDSLEDYVELSNKAKRTESEDNAFQKVKENLRKQIVKTFVDASGFKDLFKKELIREHLPNMYENDIEHKKIIENFALFTTYFTGFQKNRENLYSDEEKSTAIAYRLIHENLPMFLDNMKSFEKIAANLDEECFAKLEKAYSEYLNVNTIAENFQLDNFTNVLTQEHIEVYNNIIGGKTEEDGTKIQGINEYVNLYNQQHKDNRLPLLKPLYKMILSDREVISWLPEKFESDAEMINAINEANKSLDAILCNGSDENSLKYLLSHISDFDLEHIYITNDLGLTNISQQIFGRYDFYTTAIKEEIKSVTKPSTKELKDADKYDDRIKKLFNSQRSFSIKYLDSVAAADQEHFIGAYFSQLGAYDRNEDQHIDLFNRLALAINNAKDILEGKHSNISQSNDDTARIKGLLDVYKDIQSFIKPLLGNGDEAEKDNEFDARLRHIWSELSIITRLYDKVRNWLTRKPYSTEKIKLNFENSQLLGGWDVNKEPDCTAVLLRKGKEYFLAIMDKKANHAFDIDNLPCDGECYQKIDYKLLPGANKMLPKVFFSKKNIGYYSPSETVLDIRRKESFKKGDHFSLSDCHTFIDFFKQSIAKHEDWKKFPFTFSDTSEYEDISGFYQEVEQQGYMLNYRDVSVSFINELVDNGKLYLFKIWNKDFSEHSKGTPNMHTLYWNMLFDEKNLADVVYKLNGQAEVFYRKKSLDIDKTFIHKAQQPINNKNQANAKKQSSFDYDIVKDRRYTVDKFQFHVPITMNFKSKGHSDLNSHVREIIRNNGIKHIIGIDRGERHLLYLSLIDLKGNIIKQMTLNDIVNEYNGKSYSTNYKQLLEYREEERTEARRNWQTIENIKDLKEGYLSQVVHVITKMMVEYNAIVVLEDLNMGFMRGRQKIERSVYEQFEKKLIDKLNYCVDKKISANEPGGLLHALQLTSQFESFKKLGKQSGCLFYIPAWNTSKIDPVTGFVNLLDTRYENVDKARKFFSLFDSIRFNKEKDWFEFTLDYDKFNTKAEGTRTKWTLCTYGTRIKAFRNQMNKWDTEEVVLTDEFKKVFQTANIDINGNLKNSICGLTEKQYLEPLMHLMSLLVQLRNSKTNTEIDYMLSPVADQNGVFFDSRQCPDTLPKDADANGAYNIARKGIWVIRKIQESSVNDKIDLKITNKEWLNFAQQKPYLDD